MRKLDTLKRLRIAHLLLGMMFFYGIEQVFLNKVIGTPSARGILTAVYVATVLVFDVPTGVFADKFGRKLSLIAACIAAAVSLGILGTSMTLAIYLLGAVFFGIYISLLNGAAEALLYDWLASNGKAKLYGKFQGSIYALYLIGAGIANVASGFMAKYLGLRSTYFLSIGPALLALYFIAGITEPPIEKKETSALYGHVRTVLHEINMHRRILVYALQFIAAEIVLLTIGEFGQIYILAFGVSTVMLGIFWAITALVAAGGRTAAHQLQARPKVFILTFCAVLFAFAIVNHAFGIGLFWLVYGLNEALQNIAETEIQHETSSNVRATMLSVIGFVGNALAVPVVLLYTAYYTHHGILRANRLVIGAIIGLLLVSILVRYSKRSLESGTVEPAPFLAKY